ncbi:carbon-nitrogen hydrolase family protein [Chloroflexota bacterium]
MKATVCQLNLDAFEDDWERLVEYVQGVGSQVVLLPEMPFYRWFARRPKFDPSIWAAALEAHKIWLGRLAELAPAVILATRPVERDGLRLNEAFVWEPYDGCFAAHHKAYLPDEEGFWEASWYRRGEGDFSAVQVNNLRVGFLVCTEMWFTQHGRAYGVDGIHLLAVPRATQRQTFDKWLAGGRATAVVSGAYCLSSCCFEPGEDPLNLGGGGWVVEPDGRVLGVTSQEQPFLTVDLDLMLAEQAKSSYPRYVKDL